VSEGNGKIPQEQGINREVGYRRPPVEHRIKPGEIRNPNGRPKGTSVTAELRRLLDETVKAGKGRGKTRREAFARKLLEFAQRGRAGDASYAKEVLNRVEGSVPTDEELTIRFVLVRQDPAAVDNGSN
jgi:hypothetical protein